MDLTYVVFYSDGRIKAYRPKDVKRGIAAMTAHSYYAPTVQQVYKLPLTPDFDVTEDFK